MIQKWKERERDDTEMERERARRYRNGKREREDTEMERESEMIQKWKEREGGVKRPAQIMIQSRQVLPVHGMVSCTKDSSANETQ